MIPVIRRKYIHRSGESEPTLHLEIETRDL
jgi:hypothetical protein